MRRPSKISGRSVAVALATAAVVGAASGALVAQGQSGSTMPAAPPSDASAAGLTVVNRTVAANPTRFRGFNAFQTYTYKAPSGRAVLQGFATISGGNTGSVVITSTKATPRQFTVELEFPGEQGTPGKINVRVQLVPRN
jgi:hypothetical protein